MKRKHLPLSLVLITIVLGGLLLSFTTKQSESKHSQLVANNDMVVSAASGYLALIRNNQSTGLIKPEDLKRVQSQLREFNNSRSTANITWSQLGPDNFGGRTRAIIFDNLDGSANTVFAAGVTGGIWKSDDLGISWHKTNGKHFNLNVSCMKQDANGIIYAGTGESFATETMSALGEMGFSSGIMGQGIFKSTNGDNFTLIESTQPEFNDDNSDWAYVNELAVDMNSGRLYAAANSGIKYSDNGGDSWMIPNYSYDTLSTNVTREYEIVCDSFEIVSGSMVIYGPDTTFSIVDTTKNITIETEFELLGNATDVVVNSEGDVVVSIDNKCYVLDKVKNVFRNVSAYPDNIDIMHNDSIFTTSNILPLNGQSDTSYSEIAGGWHFYQDLHQSKLPASNVSRIEFAFAPSNPNVLYATVINGVGFLFNIYRSDNKGLTWRVIQPGSASIPIFGGQGVYDNTLTVFPEDPDKILVGGIDAWEFKKVQETGFFASKSISTTNPFFVEPYDPEYLPVNHHVYVFRPGFNNTFFVGTDGGVAIGSIVEGEYVFETSNRSYYTTQFYNIAPSGIENYVLGGSQANGSVLITGEGSAVREGKVITNNIDGFLFYGSGGSCEVSLINKDVLVASGTDAHIYRSEDAGEAYSTQFTGGLELDNEYFNTPMALWENFDNINSRDSLWYFAKEEIAGGTKIQVRSKNSGQPFYYTTPTDVTLFPDDSILVRDVVSSRYFISSLDVVYMTNELHRFDKTPEWFEISNDNVGFEGNPQCISYSSDANHIFVGTREGKLFRISNLARAYNYDRADVNSPECIVSTKEITLNIPGTPDLISQVITSVAVDPGNPSNVMITLGNYGNDYYVFYSENALDEFPVFNSRQGNLPQMPVYSSIIEMTDNNMGIIGSEHGIFVTENIHSESPVWMHQDSLMGSVPVFQLDQQVVNKSSDTVYLVNGNEITKLPYPGTNNLGIIYAATYGRGLFRANAFRKPVGVEEIPNTNVKGVLNLDVYPNPVSSYATIEFESNSHADASIFVYDISGRMLLSRISNVNKGLNKLDLDLSGLNSGTHIIQVLIGSDTYSQKIVIN